MGWIERHDGVTAQGDLGGNPSQAILIGSVERAFIVTTDVTPDVIISNPSSILGGADGVTPLPAYGTPHPRVVGAVLRSYVAQGAPPNVNVRAMYTAGNIDPLGEEFFGQSGDFFEESDTLPAARKDTYVVNNGGEVPPGGGPPTPPVRFPYWNIADAPEIKVIYTSRQHTMSVNVGGLIGDTITAMDNQNNRLHRINGRYYRFKAGGYTEIRSGIWLVNYQFFYDSGTLYDPSLSAFDQPFSRLAIPQPITGGPGPGDPVLHPGANPLLGRTGVQYMRLPYHKRLIVAADPDNPAARPQFPHFLPYFVDPNGWQELVGLT